MRRPCTRPVFALAIAATLLQTSVCFGENATDVEIMSHSETDVAISSYTLYDESGAVLTMRGGQIWPGDEYISGDDRWYRVVSVDDAARAATAEYLGPAADDARTAFAAKKAAAKTGDKLIAMYSTHSDESYVPDDGAASKWRDAGIYDVGDSLKDALEKRGIKTIYSRETFLPHDADAYTRSRRTAEELLKQGPDALLDIHRDAVPAEQYETEVNGEDISKVRLFVGRTNQNAAENRAFAQQIKAEADRQYPGLIKDIFIGKGNYNQDLSPNSLLLEFGTHEIDKEKAQEAAAYVAEVLDSVLFGPAARAEGAAGQRSGAVARGIGWAVALAAIAAIAYALLSTGSLRGAWEKLGRRASELTGGMIGRKDKY